jgi:hypothetical protein
VKKYSVNGYGERHKKYSLINEKLWRGKYKSKMLSGAITGIKKKVEKIK